MKGFLYSVLFISYALTLYAQDQGSTPYETGQAAAEASEKSVLLPALGWTVIIGAAIGSLVMMIPTENTGTSSH